MSNTIKFDDDVWKIKFNNISLGDTYKIDFRVVDNTNLRQQFKEVMWNMISTERIKNSSIIQYWGKIKNYFLPFIAKLDYEIDYFSDITKEIINLYIFHIKNLNVASSTKSTILSSLKAFVNVGIDLELANFPEINIVPDSISDIFGVDDVLHTKYIEPEITNRIKVALSKETDIYFKSLLVLAIETGLRLSELLTIQKGCILEDFEGHPVLYTYSIKIEEEIYQAVNQNVVEVVKILEEAYTENPNEYLFFRNSRLSRQSTGRLYSQTTARSKLKYFLKKHGFSENITYHTFRHTLGTDMNNNGATIHQIRTQLNHKSYHSTNLYAKIKSTTVDKEYYRMGVLGLDENKLINYTSDTKGNLGCGGSLADGECKNIIDEDGYICTHFNKCLKCNKFIAFEEDLYIHKSHLERLKKDRELYMYEEGLNSIDQLLEIELALEVIVNGGKESC